MVEETTGRFDAVQPVAAWLLRPIAAQNVFEEAVGRLGQAIKLGVLAPGERFPSERELADGLQVSRTTIREALRTLEHVGYVETRRGRFGGTFVADGPGGTPPRANVKELASAMGVDELTSALDLRWALEPAAAAFAAQRRTDQDMTDLRASWQQSQHVPDAGFRVADLNFHLAIANMSHSPAIVRAVGDVQAQLSELLTAVPIVKASIQHSHEQHRKVMEAIEASDKVGARAAMEEHIAATAALVHGLAK